MSLVEMINYEHLETDLVALSRTVQGTERSSSQILPLGLNAPNVRGCQDEWFPFTECKPGGDAEE